MKPLRSEHDHQVGVFTWARGVVAVQPQSKLRWLHSTQTGLRTTALQAALAKAAGMQSGIPDLCLPAPARNFHGLWIELKVPATYDERGCIDRRAGALSDEQHAWLTFLAEAGHFAAAAWGKDAAIAALRWFLGEPLDRMTTEYGVVASSATDTNDAFSTWRPVVPVRGRA